MTPAERVAADVDNAGRMPVVTVAVSDLRSLLAERDDLAARVAELERARVCDCGRPLGNAVCAVCDRDE